MKKDRDIAQKHKNTKVGTYRSMSARKGYVHDRYTSRDSELVEKILVSKKIRKKAINY